MQTTTHRHRDVSGLATTGRKPKLKEMKYSVLMSVYRREKPEYLRQSILSMLNQTLPPAQFVLVKDGELPSELEAVIDEAVASHPGLFCIVELEKNEGIGAAAAKGLAACTCEYVAKMDSDDIAKSHRCERQMEQFLKDENLDIVGSHITEFIGDIENPVADRIVPVNHDDIVRFARRRAPFNNQTVIYRKEAVLKAGGYMNLRRCEDYNLYIRMLHNGAKAMNIDESLVYYRLTDDTYNRRASLRNTVAFIRTRYHAMRIGFASPLDFLVACAGQLILAVLPKPLKKMFYIKLLRNR